MDTHQFLSLHINKGDLPEGSELVFHINDAQTGELYPVNYSSKEERRAFAQNSRFFGQVMADGHVFNPLIHRRFIAAQFMRLVKQYGMAHLKAGVYEQFNWKYAIKALRNEVRSLANLEKHDLNGFHERSCFFAKETVARILSDYSAGVASYLASIRSSASFDHIHVPGYGLVNKKNIRPMQHRFVSFGISAGQCSTYQQLRDLLDGFDWLILPDQCRLSTSLVDAYVESGAYYTMKHRIMFDNLRLWKAPQAESLTLLRAHSGRYTDLYSCID